MISSKSGAFMPLPFDIPDSSLEDEYAQLTGAINEMINEYAYLVDDDLEVPTILKRLLLMQNVIQSSNKKINAEWQGQV